MRITILSHEDIKKDNGSPVMQFIYGAIAGAFTYSALVITFGALCRIGVEC